MTELHTHPRSDELAVYWIPSDPGIPCELKVIGNGWHDMTKLVSGFITIARNPAIPKLHCGCLMVMVVNEEGQLHQMPPNPRVQAYYDRQIVGDVFLVGEGLVPSDEGPPEIDFFTLPPSMINWEGPLHPLPKLELQPWESL